MSRQTTRRAGRDTLLLPIILLVFLLSCLIGTARNIFTPASVAPPPGTELGEVDDYPPGAVVYYERAGTFIVRLSNAANASTTESGIIALSDRDPVTGCTVSHYPNDSYIAEDGTQVKGVFREMCRSLTYRNDGSGITDPATRLRRLPLRLSGKSLYVEVPRRQ